MKALDAAGYAGVSLPTMRRVLELAMVVVAVGGAALLGYVVGHRASPAAADPTPPKSAGPPTDAASAKRAKLDLRVKNICYVSPPDPDKEKVGANKVLVEVLLDGVSGGQPAQAIVSGMCRYWWGDEPAFGVGKRARSWDCELKTFGAGWPPHLAAQDIRGNPELENWYGQKPQPMVGDRKSLHPLRIDGFELEGPGQLAIDCDARTEEFDSSALTPKCKMSWYNKFVPAESHLEGTCGVEAVVRDD